MPPTDARGGPRPDPCDADLVAGVRRACAGTGDRIVARLEETGFAAELAEAKKVAAEVLGVEFEDDEVIVTSVDGKEMRKRGRPAFEEKDVSEER